MDKGIELLKKVKADVIFHQVVIKNANDLPRVTLSKKLLKQNQDWLAEFQAQNNLAMKNNCKK